MDYVDPPRWPPYVSPQYQDSLECGSCGDGWMVERRGKHGPFWGCTNYPQCKQTLNHEEVCGRLGLIDPDEDDMMMEQF